VVHNYNTLLAVINPAHGIGKRRRKVVLDAPQTGFDVMRRARLALPSPHTTPSERSPPKTGHADKYRPAARRHSIRHAVIETRAGGGG